MFRAGVESWGEIEQKRARQPKWDGNGRGLNIHLVGKQLVAFLTQEQRDISVHTGVWSGLHACYQTIFLPLLQRVFVFICISQTRGGFCCCGAHPGLGTELEQSLCKVQIAYFSSLDLTCVFWNVRRKEIVLEAVAGVLFQATLSYSHRIPRPECGYATPDRQRYRTSGWYSCNQVGCKPT